MAELASGPKVLLLGGVGMIGRNFVKYLVDKDLCSSITVADKAMPQIAFMNESHENAFDHESVTYIQADLTKEIHLDKVFGKDGEAVEGRYDFVFNLAAETRLGQSELLYDERCRKLSKLCAERSAKGRVKRFIEVSTALVYKAQKSRAHKEDGILDPWTLQAKAKLAAERHVLDVEGLDAVVLRPAFVYGIGDVSGLMPRIVCAASYQQMGETMKFLWDKTMRINTVHVDDVCRALFHVTSDRIPRGAVYNLADKNDTDQAKVNTVLGTLFGKGTTNPSLGHNIRTTLLIRPKHFSWTYSRLISFGGACEIGIKTGFHGIIISNLARLNLQGVIEAANEKHMKPWDVVCRAHKIVTTPLSPYMSQELLSNNSLYVDGSLIESTGFNYAQPTVDPERIREEVQAAIDLEIFPPIIK